MFHIPHKTTQNYPLKYENMFIDNNVFHFLVLVCSLVITVINIFFPRLLNVFLSQKHFLFMSASEITYKATLLFIRTP